MRLAATDRRLSYYFLATPSGGAVTLRSQKSVNNNMDFLILRLTEIARIQKWLDIDFSHKDKALTVSDRPEVRGGEDPREIEMTRRETTSPEADTASTGVNNDMYCPT